MTKPTRRAFLKSGALAAGSAVLRNAPAFVTPMGASAAATPLTQFQYHDVQLLDGPMLEQFRQNHELFLNLNDDSLLKPFRQLSGLPAPGEDMGGWYSPSPLFDPPKNMTGYVPGHSFGQYLSGLARAYAVTGDKPTQAKVQRLVAGFAPTISQKFYSDYCIPAYTFDKTNCGLIDAHQFARDPQALAVLNHATDAVLPFLPPKALDRAEMMARPHKNISFTWDETYTLPENFYLAYQRGAGSRYRQLAQRFLQDDTYFGPLSENKNVLPGQHAYSHVNALNSAMQAYLTDGSQKHLTAARNGFAFVQQQSFATGGWGPNETFQEPNGDGLADSLTKTHSSFETPCGAYGHFKITRYLMGVTGDSRYGDSMETILYNTILGARPIRSDGVSFYYSDYNRDAKKVDYEQEWPCCSGTFPQLTADYGISSYFRSAKGINVNLYVPSRINWQQGSAHVSLTQQTQYPANGDTSMHLALSHPERFVVALRIPTWAGKSTKVTVNGKPVDTALTPGTWASIDRIWKNDDRIELSLDMPLRLAPIDDRHPQFVALLYGPVALFAIEPSAEIITQKQLLAAQRIGDSSAWQVATDSGNVRMVPFPEIKNETYRLYQQT
ncbi:MULTISPECIES: beta-L-arabinofuranosidase domain-containing protein [Acidobacteriaceae]|uniref:beta-L-arabinofuranosidase domain-containing protein n=1 Tax=Acidobacteriaceae TaxID=204434 RepID=UPI00131B994A|nr:MULTISPECIES: beta-L-arabinofuranosidase domain-containing protein [Acidobacteriaceae]MDW5266915.1 glycoside hydrolase family 127 protein [Edaphobacter sp.]